LALIFYIVAFYSIMNITGIILIIFYSVFIIVSAIMISRLAPIILIPFSYFFNYYMVFFINNNVGYMVKLEILITVVFFSIIGYIIGTLAYKREREKNLNKKIKKLNRLYLRALRESHKINDIEAICRKCGNIKLLNKNEWITEIEFFEKRIDGKLNTTICPSCIEKLRNEFNKNEL